MIILEFNWEGGSKPLKVEAYKYVCHYELDCGTKCAVKLSNGDTFIALHPDVEMMEKLRPARKAKGASKTLPARL